MEMSPSKQKILEEALRLFSTNGYEATSIRQITDAVGIRKASLYSHFQSKREILDTLIADLTEFYEEKLLLKKTDWNNEEEIHKLLPSYTEDNIFQIVKKQLVMVVHDPYISMMRKLLIVEQFRNPELASLYHRFDYSDVLNFYKGMIQYLIDKEVFVDENVEAMAMEFMALIYIQVNRIQRDPACEEDAMRMIEQHVKHIFRLYSRSFGNIC